MNTIEMFNSYFGRHLVEQTGNAVADAQRALSSGHQMAKGGTAQRIASGWAVIGTFGATMQFKLAAKGVTYSDLTRYEAFASTLDSLKGEPVILIEFDKKPVPVENIFATYDLRAVRICSCKGVETFDYTVEPEKDGSKTHKVLWRNRKDAAKRLLDPITHEGEE
jgi:hypothetical protein